ncbi:hypothetical protein [Rhizobium leguminosarum]|uniref:hypothetical protein n=1 Tax=Rhizobium leguminosarum TaxID=384 RepID=UPI001FDF7B2A|nr:hypothetical protein [Rhizobium leguminosarum]
MAYIFGGDTGKTQGEVSDQRKRLAYAMLQQGMDMSPVQSPWQGAARLAQALMGGLEIRQQDEEQRASTAEAPAAPIGTPSPPPAQSRSCRRCSVYRKRRHLAQLARQSRKRSYQEMSPFEGFSNPGRGPGRFMGAMTPAERKL